MTMDRYVTAGQFARDGEAAAIATTGLSAAAMPAETFTARLPASTRDTLRHMVDMLHDGTFPNLSDFRVTKHSWGFDFAAHGVEVLDADFEGDLSGDVFSMAADGGGNHLCLKADGKVVFWNHEESNIEAHTQFDSLDDALWALLHYELVCDDHERYTDEVKATFVAKASPGENGWSFLLEQLEEILEDS